MAALSAAGAFTGDALLVPISEVGSLAVGVGWFASCVAYLAMAREGRLLAAAGAIVAGAIVLMKVVPAVPGSFTRAEWLAFGAWSASIVSGC